MASVLEIIIRGRDQFTPTGKKVQSSARGIGGAMKGVGTTMVGVAGGFIAAQASILGVQKIMSSSIGAAMKFEAQMAQIRALTGATAEDTDFLSGAIKDLSKEIGKSPEELGAGAYFILSSGIEDAADAAEVLEIAAKASTIGLGETERVADALTTVINAYGLEASDAARVTDVMIEAVKQGKAEAGAFAGVLGRVVPLAAQMGINFEEVAANLATFTRLGVSADEAATGLRSVMSSLIKPSDDAQEAMAELGLSAEGLREQIREKGLLAVLDDLMERTGGNEEALARLFPNIRALTSILGTAGGQLEDYNDILGATENATGNLEEGFAIVSDTAQQKMKVAVAELNIVMLELGEEVLPTVALAIVGAADAFIRLTDGVEEVIGPVVWLDQKIKELGEDYARFAGEAVTGSKEAQDAMVDAFNAAGDAAGGSGGYMDQVRAAAEAGKEFGATTVDIKAVGDELGEVVGTAEDFRADMASVTIDVGGEIDRMKQRAMDMAAAMEDEVAPAAVTALQAILDKASEAGDAIDDMMRVTTVESANAEAALAALELEAFNLENKVGDLTGAEADRLAQLTDELIPAEEKNLEKIELEIDAAGKLALSKDGTLVSVRTLIGGIEDEGEALSDVGDEYDDLRVNKMLATEKEWLEEHRILTTLLTPALEDYKDVMSRIPSEVRTSLLIDLPEDIAASLLIGPQIIGAQHGFHGMVNGPQGFFIEPGMTERVDITPQAQIIGATMASPSGGLPRGDGGGGGGVASARGGGIHVTVESRSLLPPSRREADMIGRVAAEAIERRQRLGFA